MDFFDSFPFTRLQGKNRGLDWVMQKIAEFQKAIDNIPEAVKSLTAKDLNAAPDGYGLGVYGVSLLDAVDANECKQIGWYKLSSATLNGIGAPALMRTDGYSVKHVVQTAFSGDASADSFIIKQRICKGGIWGVWESVRSNNWLPTIAEIGAAPAGYGLGTGAVYKNWNDVNSLYQNGTYYFGNISIPGLPAEYGVLVVSGIDTNFTFHTLYPLTNSNLCLRRQSYDGTWKPWEWVNPPMLPGVEYRTTERWNGKAVYTKLINIGTFNGNSGKEFSIGTIGTDYIPFRWRGFATKPDGINLQIPSKGIVADMYLYETGGTTYIYMSIQPNSLGDITLNGQLQIWYTKD